MSNLNFSQRSRGMGGNPRISSRQDRAASPTGWLANADQEKDVEFPLSPLSLPAPSAPLAFS